jgi:hypothetical protein
LDLLKSRAQNLKTFSKDDFIYEVVLYEGTEFHLEIAFKKDGDRVVASVELTRSSGLLPIYSGPSRYFELVGKNDWEEVSPDIYFDLK